MTSRREFIAQASLTSLLATSAQLAPALAADSRAAPTRRLGAYNIPRTELVVSRLAYGCAMLGFDWSSPDSISQASRVINVAYDQGINFYDLADVYGLGKSESALGEVLRQSPGLRNKVVIQSKCGVVTRPGDSWGTFNLSREHIMKSVEGSLRRLGTGHLDVLLLHWPDALVRPEEVAAAFDELHQSGKVRYFGVSNHNRHQIELLRKHLRQPLIANQIHLGLAHWYVDANSAQVSSMHGDEGAVMVDYCRVHELQVQAYSPLRVNLSKDAPNLLKPAPEASPQVKAAAALLTDLANKYYVSPAAVMLAWLLQHPAGIVPIIGSAKPDHVIDNCTADQVELNREDWYRLLHTASAIHS